PGLTVQEQERDHADEGWQHDGQGDERAEGLAARELEPLEEKRERDADRSGERHARRRDPDAGPQHPPLPRPRHERGERPRSPGTPASASSSRSGRTTSSSPGPAPRARAVLPRSTLARPTNVATNRLVGCSYSSSGVASCSSRPAWSTATRSPRSNASSCSWVTKMVVMPTRLI